MFYHQSDNGYQEVLPRIEMKTLVNGDQTLVTEFRMRAGSVLPKHQHQYEQTGYLIKGRLRLTIGEKTFDVRRVIRGAF